MANRQMSETLPSKYAYLNNIEQPKLWDNKNQEITIKNQWNNQPDTKDIQNFNCSYE